MNQYLYKSIKIWIFLLSFSNYIFTRIEQWNLLYVVDWMILFRFISSYIFSIVSRKFWSSLSSDQNISSFNFDGTTSEHESTRWVFDLNIYCNSRFLKPKRTFFLFPFFPIRQTIFFIYESNINSIFQFHWVMKG